VVFVVEETTGQGMSSMNSKPNACIFYHDGTPDSRGADVCLWHSQFFWHGYALQTESAHL